MNYHLSILATRLSLIKTDYVRVSKSRHGGAPKDSPGRGTAQSGLVCPFVCPHLSQTATIHGFRKAGEYFKDFQNTDNLPLGKLVQESVKAGEMNFHASSCKIGKIAAQTNTKRPGLSHVTTRNLKGLGQIQVEIRNLFAIEMVIGADLNYKGI